MILFVPRHSDAPITSAWRCAQPRPAVAPARVSPDLPRERESRPKAAPKTPAKASESTVSRSTGNGWAGAPSATLLARLVRDEGIERANGNGSAWWRSCADAAIAYLASTGLPWSSDDLYDLGLPPADHPCRIGGAVHAAAKAGLIRQTGFALSRRRSRHAGVLRVWVGAA